MVGDSTNLSTGGGLVTKLDPVAVRLTQAGDEHSSALLAWVDGRRMRSAWRTRASWCFVGAWLMVCLAALIGSGVAWIFSRSAGEVFLVSGYVNIEKPYWLTIMPVSLAVLSAIMVLGGFYLWFTSKVPGLSTTQKAIDWANTTDAVSKLLAAGCTYPEAFETAARVAKTPSNRRWLLLSANQIKSGQPLLAQTSHNDSDAAVVELLTEAGDAEASHHWGIASQHFVEVAKQRLSLWLSITPAIATLIAGFIVWLSISATLGWIWKSAVQSIKSLS